MTLNEIGRLALEMADLAMSRSASKQLRARELAALIAKELPRAQWAPEVACAYCKRERRAWFATGIRRQRLWPLCSRACVGHWHNLTGCQVYVGHGREWLEEMPGRRVA